MKRRILLAVLLAALMIVTGSSGCLQPEIPRQNTNLNFIFQYGVGAADILNTFDNSYTRDMVAGPPERIRMFLTDDEMNRIYAKMQEIGFFDYPTQFSIPTPKGPIGIVTPYQSYYFKVTMGTQVKELTWGDSITIPASEQVDRLRELIRLIENIITAKPEYKNLPPPRGGYM